MNLNEVSPPGWGHTKAEKEKTKPNKPKSKIGGSAAAFKRALDDGRFKGLPGSTTKKEKTADMFKLMWSMKKKGDKPHYKPGTDKKYKKYQEETHLDEGSLRKWFKGSKSKDGKGGWVNVVTGGTCASDEPGEGTPKCVSSAKRASMTKAERLSASRRKKAADPGQQQKSGAAKPTYVRTDSKKKMKEETAMQDNNLYGDAYAGLKRKIGSKKKHDKPAVKEGVISTIIRPKKKEERKPKKAMDAGARLRRKVARRDYADRISGSEDLVPDSLRDHVEYNEDRDLKKIAKELDGASKMHKGQANRVRKHIKSMKEGKETKNCGCGQDPCITYGKKKKVDEACWKGYKAYGMKKKGNKMVPNCKPVGSVKESAIADANKDLAGPPKPKRTLGKKVRRAVLLNMIKRGKSKAEIKHVMHGEEVEVNEGIRRKIKVGMRLAKREAGRLVVDDPGNPYSYGSLGNPKPGDKAKRDKERAAKKRVKEEVVDEGMGRAIKKAKRIGKRFLDAHDSDPGRAHTIGTLGNPHVGNEEKRKKERAAKRGVSEAKVDDVKYSKDEKRKNYETDVHTLSSNKGVRSDRNKRRSATDVVFHGHSKVERDRKQAHYKSRGVKKVKGVKEEVVAEADKKGKGSGTKDACYHKVKASAKVWPSAYASGRLVQCRKKGAANYGKSKSEEFEGWASEPILEKVAAWQRKEGKNPEGGLNQKGVDSYRAANPGSKLKTAVTTKPSKLKKGSKSANRRKSFCARMSGMKKKLTSAKTANDPDSRINKSLRKWNC
jgi:hypothetical protein